MSLMGVPKEIAMKSASKLIGIFGAIVIFVEVLIDKSLYLYKLFQFLSLKIVYH